MQRLLLLILLLFLVSCSGSKKSIGSKDERTISVAAANESRLGKESRPITPVEVKKPNSGPKSKADKIINTALTFSGAPYKFGGTTSKGMDCSGLLYVSFGENNIQLPRTSIHMAEEGKKIRVSQVEKGDLLFFRTSRRAKRINHVGMVVSVSDDEIKFIHASTSRGVTVSSLREGYWNSAFVKATRIL